MFGGSGSWYYTTLAGLQRAPGSRSWKDLVIAPPFSKGMLAQLTSANASIDSPMGVVQSAWSWSSSPASSAAASTAATAPEAAAAEGAGSFTLSAIVPPNAKARVLVPQVTAAADKVVIRESNVIVWEHGAFVRGAVDGIKSAAASADGNTVAFAVGSGRYIFVSS